MRNPRLIQTPYNNQTLYGAAKTCNEGMLRSFYDMYGLDYVALRYFNVYGPRMDIHGKYTEVLIRWLDALDQGALPKIMGDGQQTMDFVYSGDVARVNILAMCSEVTDEICNVGQGQEVSLLQLLETLLKLTGHADLSPEFLPARTVNAVQRRLADTKKAEELLGFRAETSLEEGLEKLIAWRREMIEKGTFKAYTQI